VGIEEARSDLNAYISYIDENMPKISGSVGHLTASMLIGFRTGLYDRAIGRADRILEKIKGNDKHKALVCAVKIIRTHSIELLPSQKSIRSTFNWEGNDPTKTFGVNLPEETECRFSGEDEKYYAVRLKKDEIKVPQEFQRDNAMILAYTCAYISSPEDRLPLEEQVLGYVLQRIEYYQKEE